MSEHVLMTNSVNPPLTLFQELVEVSLFYPIKSTQLTFRLVPEILNTVVMILLVSEEFWMIHSPMMKTRDVKFILSLEAVFVYNTDRNHLFLDYRQNDLGLSIWNDGDVDLVFLLEQPKDGNFSICTPASFPLSFPPKQLSSAATSANNSKQGCLLAINRRKPFWITKLLYWIEPQPILLLLSLLPQQQTVWWVHFAGLVSCDFLMYIVAIIPFCESLSYFKPKRRV